MPHRAYNVGVLLPMHLKGSVFFPALKSSEKGQLTTGRKQLHSEEKI